MLKLKKACPFLFKNKKLNGNHVSQTATFDPVVALNSKNAWVSSATPSSAVTPKKLIISRELLFDHPNVNEWIAWISWLQHLDIPVYLCTKTSPRFRLLSKETKFAELMQDLDVFKTEDYKELAEKMALARDECVVPSKTERGQLMQFLKTIDNKYSNVPELFIKKHMQSDKDIIAILTNPSLKGNLPSYVEKYIVEKFKENGKKFSKFLYSYLEKATFSNLQNIPQEVKSLAQKHREILLEKFYEGFDKFFIFFPDEPQIHQEAIRKILLKQDNYEDLTFLYLNWCEKIDKKIISELIENLSTIHPVQYDFLIEFSLKFDEKLMCSLIKKTKRLASSSEGLLLLKKLIRNGSKEFAYFILDKYLTDVTQLKITKDIKIIELVNLYQDKDKEDLLDYVIINTKKTITDSSSKKKLLENLFRCASSYTREKLIKECSLDVKNIPTDSTRGLLTYMTINNNELPEIKRLDFNIFLLSESPLFEKICPLIKPESVTSFEELRSCLRVAYSKPALQKYFIENLNPFYDNDIHYFEGCLLCCAEENRALFIEKFEMQYKNEHVKDLVYSKENNNQKYLIKYNWENKNTFLSEILLEKNNSVYFETLGAMPLLAEHNNESIITEFYINVDACSESYSTILNKIKNKEFPWASVVTVFGDNDKKTEEMSDAIKQHCPQIQIIQYESAIQERKKSTLDIMLGNNDVVLQKQQTVWTPKGGLNESLINSKMSFPSRRDENNFYISKDSSSNEIRVDGGVNLGGSYINHETGKALNKPKDQQLPRVRTCIYSVAIEEKEIKLTKCFPEKFETLLIVKKIENKDLSEYKLRPPEKDGVYYYFAQSVPAGQWTRLLSVEANESLEAYIASPDKIKLANIKFAKGDDGFVYAYSDQACDLQYVLKTPMLKKELDSSHPAKKIIEEFKSNDKYEETAAEQAPKITGSAKKWLEELFESRKGACQERCLAVWHQILKKHPELSETVRLVRIDNNHVRMEIISNGIVYQEDLGGAEAEMIMENNNKPLPVFEPSEVPKEKKQPVVVQKKEPPEEYLRLKQLFVKEPKKITDKVEFLKCCYQTNKKLTNEKFLRTLIINDRQNHNEAINFLIKVFQETGKTFKVIDKFEDINLNDNKDKILIQKNETPIIGSVTESAPDYFIIDWNTITEEQRVRANHIFAEPKLNIISFCKNKPTDASFLRRHDEELIDITGLDLKPALVKTENPECFEIDLRAYPNWEKQMFAPVVLVENKLAWPQKLLVKKLQEVGKLKKSIEIKITNVPQDAVVAIKKMIQRACAEGSFSYLGFEIPLSKNIKISVDEKRLDFSKFEKMDTGLIKNSHDGKFEIINSARFELLLQQKDIPNGIYTQKPGLVELRKGGNLQINITSDLSEEQWYALLDECLLHKVELACHLDKGVNVPVAVQNRFTIKENINPVIEMPESVINEDGFEIVIHVEDCCAQDFLGHIDYTIKDNQFYFNVRECEFLEKLKEGKKILLKGEFSTHLWQELEPLRRDPAKYLQERFPNEIFSTPVIEFWRDPPVNKIEPIVYEEPEPENNEINFEKAKENADSFIKNRIDKVMDALKEHSMLELIGESGVGKSSLIKEINDCKLAKVYRGLSEIPKWANDKTNKPKILFIDESNIENFHLTVFEPLKNLSNTTKPRRIFWEGVFYELDENCLVVLARNPCEYGGGRNEQKLSEDNRVPKIIMHDFPFDYMYAQILKPLYHGEDEQGFNEFCYKLLQTYGPKKMTVRDLQEDVLKKYTPMKSKFKFLESKNFIQDPNYLLFPSSQSLRSEIISFLNVRKNSPNGLGLNLYMVEGPPGVGKSVLIVNILKTQKIPYVLIKASLSVQEKIEQIKSAIKNNQAVIIDELNSCIDDGLEKFLNEVLTSPESKLIMFATCNSMSEEGRSKFSPAICKRSYYRYMQHPTVEDFKGLIRSKIDKLNNSDSYKMEDAYLLFLHNKDNKEEIINKMSQDLADLVKNEPTANLQRILEKFEEVLMIYAPITLGKTETNEETRAFTIF